LVDGKPVVSKDSVASGMAEGAVHLDGGTTAHIEVRYSHATGGASLHVMWSGPMMTSRLLESSSHPEGI
jgi:hypothetical protein